MPVHEGRGCSKGAEDAAVGPEPKARECDEGCGFFDLRKNGIEAAEEARKCLSRRTVAGVEQCRAGRCLHTPHEDAGGESVTADIGEERDEIAVRQRDGVNEIAADFLTGLRNSVNLEARRADLERWNECSLNTVRELELVLDAQRPSTFGADEGDEGDVGADACDKHAGSGEANSLLRRHRMEIECTRDPIGQHIDDSVEKKLRDDEYRDNYYRKTSYAEYPCCGVQSRHGSYNECDGVRVDASAHDVGVEAGDGEKQKGCKQQYPEPVERDGAESRPARYRAPVP